MINKIGENEYIIIRYFNKIEKKGCVSNNVEIK